MCAMCGQDDQQLRAGVIHDVLQIDDAGAVAGLLTRDSIVQAMAEAVKDPARLNGSATAADAGSIQAKATKRA